ncbi:MAG: hypothetical protein LBM61_03260 [Prevotellaceae bacterium]|nr:hypothetical protein [Prevotellaceae bacterium]
MKITKSVISATKPHNPTPQVSVEPTSGFSAWGTPILRVSPAVTQIERLRRSATPWHTPTPQLYTIITGERCATPQVYTIITGERCTTPQALNLRNPMQAERSDAQLGVVTPPLTTTPAGVEPPSGFSGWGTPPLRVSPAVTQIERLRRSATPAILYSDSIYSDISKQTKFIHL